MYPPLIKSLQDKEFSKTCMEKKYSPPFSNKWAVSTFPLADLKTSGSVHLSHFPAVFLPQLPSQFEAVNRIICSSNLTWTSVCGHEAQAVLQVPGSFMVSQSSCYFLRREITQEVHASKPALGCKSLGNFRTVVKFQNIFSPLPLATRGSDVQKLTRKASGKSRAEDYTGWSKVMIDWVIKFYNFCSWMR